MRIKLNKFFIIVFSGSVFFATAIFSQKNSNEIILNWTNPENGTAVDIDSDQSFDQSTPVSEAGSLDQTELKLQVSPRVSVTLTPEQQKINNEANTEIAAKAAQVALDFYMSGTKVVKIKGSSVHINSDCSNFVRAVYYVASDSKVDLFEESIATGAASANSGSGVYLLAKYFEKNHHYKKKSANVGDVIIFDNTWDKNNNQKRDDNYTHTGIVTAVRDDGTIEFIHGNVGRDQIKIGYINFKHNTTTVEGTPVNSYLRPKYKWEGNLDRSHNLTFFLLRAFGGY